MNENDKRTILIIDDEPFVLAATSRVLREAGYVVYTAELWAKVAGLIRQTNPDLILLDYNMPSLKGDDLCTIIKGSSLKNGMKVVFYSAEKLSFLREVADRSKADGYIPKGIPPQQLVDEVGRLMPRGPAQSKAPEQLLNNALVIDDSPIVRRMCRTMISRKYQCEVGEAVDGLSGMDLLSKKSYDLIILDVNMPGMNGLQFLAEAGRSGRLNGASVIICSTEGSQDDVLRGMRNGAAGYLVKPFTPDAFYSVVDGIIRRRKGV